MCQVLRFSVPTGGFTGSLGDGAITGGFGQMRESKALSRKAISPHQHAGKRGTQAAASFPWIQSGPLAPQQAASGPEDTRWSKHRGLRRIAPNPG